MRFIVRLLAVGVVLCTSDLALSASSVAPEQRTTLAQVTREGVRVERGYTPSPLGQIHYQDVGPTLSAEPIHVLIHQVPWFHLYFSRAQEELATRGIRSIAFDIPGYGLSARPVSPPTINDYAVALQTAMANLKLDRAVIVGHHTGATLGVELARIDPQRVQCLVGHGVPLYTEAEARARLAAPHWDQSYKREAAHLTERYTFLSGRLAGSADALHWSVFALFLAGPEEWFGHHAVFNYDMATSLKNLRVPTVIFSNPDDLLDFTFDRVRALRPDFSFVRLTGTSSNMAFDEAALWVEALQSSVSGCGGR
jgi:pimeloyl-ACP methyl ester carboxylesterase